MDIDDGQVLQATSFGNSAVSAPGSGATISLWTSSATATSNARIKRVIVGIYSSHASAANGLQFDVSVDNSNWRNLVSYSIAATTLTINYVATAAPFLRVRYVNSANALTTWEMWVETDEQERGTQ